MEENASVFDRINESVNEATENVRKAVNDVLDRVTGKESAVEFSLDDVGVNLGEERQVTATGTIRLSLKTLQ